MQGTSFPTEAALVHRREELAAERGRALARVNELARGQEEVSAELGRGLAEMRAQGALLDEMQAQAEQRGLLASLRRSFSRRRVILERRSAAEGLLQRYEAVSVALRRASAFSDEVRLCALELQEQVERLHAEGAAAARDARGAAERVLALEGALDALEADEGLAPEERARRRDALRFEERTASTALGLLRATGELVREELDPARALRDTMLALHDEMARFVVTATSAVNSAGRRIQALGMAADAPMVVSELHQSLAELGAAMEATEHYVAETQALLTRVLPELSAKIGAAAEASNLLVSRDLALLSREHARELADRALREAAEEEVEGLTRTL